MHPEPLPVKRFTTGEVIFIFLFLIYVVENVVFCISLYLLGNVNAGLIFTCLILITIIVPMIGLQQRSSLCMNIFGLFIFGTIIIMIYFEPFNNLSFNTILTTIYYLLTAFSSFSLGHSYRLERKPVYTV